MMNYYVKSLLKTSVKFGLVGYRINFDPMINSFIKKELLTLKDISDTSVSLNIQFNGYSNNYRYDLDDITTNPNEIDFSCLQELLLEEEYVILKFCGII